RHVDAVAVQCYGYFKDQAERLEWIHEASGKPILLADSCFAVATDDLPVPCGVTVASEEERAAEFARYARQALSVPYVLGWFWCGYLDSPDERRPGRRQHAGLKDIYGTFHEPVAATIRETYADLYGSIGAAE
ncbi:MAG: hypothetical protein MI724_10770, partial [Spirochaetales bacterium]|nr:hypothetical protein [Spirochaetales bacterium]